MPPAPAATRRSGGFAVAAALLVVGAYLYEKNKEIDETGTGEITASTSPLAVQMGPSGLALPRFVSLKSDKVNVRKGPSSTHDVAWIFHRKGLPVEIVAEYENWRKIRDSEGAEGWILQQMLSGKRSAIVMTYGHAAGAPLTKSPDTRSNVMAQLKSGVTGFVDACDGTWCEFEAQGFAGYVSQARLWGVYPGEIID